MKRITLSDIALETGLTVNTVSRALHDRYDISESTKKRVREVADQLGYVPNIAAAALKTGKTKMIAIVFDNLFNPYYNIMMHYLSKSLSERGYSFFTVVHPFDELGPDVFKQISLFNVDGIISFMIPGEEFAQRIKDCGLPMVVIGRHCGLDCIDYVHTDNFYGGGLAAQYLIDKGCKNLYYIADNMTISCSEKRYEGFSSYGKDHGVDVYCVCIDSQTSYSDAVNNILASGSPCDGIFCFSDYIAMEIRYALDCHNMREFPVIGYDNIQAELKLPGRFASVGTEKGAFAETVVKVLCERIDEQYQGAARHLTLDVKIFAN